MLQPDHQTLPHAVEIGDLLKRLPLAPLSALAVAGVHQRQAMRLVGDGRSDTGVHPAAQQHHRFGLFRHALVPNFALRDSIPTLLALPGPR